MKTINAGSFFLLVFLCFFEMMKPMCSPPLRLFLPFSFCFSLLYSPLSFSLLSSFLPSLSRLYFSCVTPCSALLSSFSHGSSLLFFFVCFPFPSASCLYRFPLCFFCSSISPLFYLSLLPCFLTVTSPLSFRFSTPLSSAVHPLAFIARGCRRFPFVVAWTE